MSGSAYCVTDLQKAIDCVASNTDSCRSCLPIDDFAEVFPERLEDQLRITLAFVPPYQPGFCDEANSRLCAYHEQSLACCCQEETKNFIQCAFNKVYITKYGVLESCSQFCGAEETGGGSSLILIIVVVTTLFISIGFCTFMYYRKRPEASGKNVMTLPAQKHCQSDVITASFVTNKTDDLSVEGDAELGGSSRSTADSVGIVVKQNAMKKGCQLTEQTQMPQGDKTTGMITPSTSKKSKSKTSLKLESSSRSSLRTESEGDPPKKPKKKKKAKAPGKVSSNSNKGSLAQHVDEEHSTSVQGMEKERLLAEREAKILRSEQRDILAENRLETKGMSKALKKLEREKVEMVQIIARLEDEKYGAEDEPYGYGDEYDTMASPIDFIDDVNSESEDEYSAINSCHDDDNSAVAGWLGSDEMSLTSGHAHDLRQRYPDPIRKLRRSRSSEKMQSTGRVDPLSWSSRSEQVGRSRSFERMQSTGMADPLSWSSRSEQVGRPRSSERMNKQVSRSRLPERMKSTSMVDPLSSSTRSEKVGRSRSSERMRSTGMVDPLSLSTRSEQVGRPRSSERMNKHKTRSTKDRSLNIDDYYAKKQRSNSSERNYGSERSEGRSVRRTKSAEKMLLPQSMPGDAKSMRARAKAEILMSRSDDGNVGRRQKLSKATSERYVPRMEPPQRGLTMTKSDKLSAREAPSQRMVRRTHSGDNLVKVER